nr:hypothetical protein [uncultured Carboxylicivirga sp.]
MKGRFFQLGILISFIFFNVFILVKYSKLKKKVTQCKFQNITRETIKEKNLETYRINSIVTLSNCNLFLQNNVIHDSLNNKSSIKVILKNKNSNTLICRFSRSDCESCVKYSIKMLSNWVNSIEKKNIIYLDQTRNVRLFKMDIQTYEIQNTNVYNTSSLNIPVEELNFPYYLVVDHNLRVLSVFVPDKASPNLTKEYLESIKTRYF